MNTQVRDLWSERADQMRTRRELRKHGVLIGAIYQVLHAFSGDLEVHERTDGNHRSSSKTLTALRCALESSGASFNLGIDSKLRGCDLVSLKVRDICHGDQVATRAVVVQHKTQSPVQFEITRSLRPPRCGAEVDQAGRPEVR
jgi:hypothetical protein